MGVGEADGGGMGRGGGGDGWTVCEALCLKHQHEKHITPASPQQANGERGKLKRITNEG